MKMQNYYETKKKNPALFYLAGPSKYKYLLESRTVFMLPKRDGRGREIYVFRIGKFLNSITFPTSSVNSIIKKKYT